MNQLEQYVHQNFQESYEEVSNSQRAHVLPMLTLEEKTIIYEYTSWEYLTVNSSLRQSNGTNVSEFAQYLDIALSKLPNYKNFVYRGADLPDTVSVLLERHFFDKKPFFLEYGFLSTSQSKITASSFSEAYLFEIFSKTGKLIADIAKNGTYSFESEEEVLFRKNTRFKVLDIKNKLIRLKEI